MGSTRAAAKIEIIRRHQYGLPAGPSETVVKIIHIGAGSSPRELQFLVTIKLMAE